MAKFVIPVEQLPPTSKDGRHSLRFRVTTEDRNSISQWSFIYNLLSSGQIPSASVSYGFTIDEAGPGTLIRLVWSGNYVEYHTELDSNPHDVFVKWDNEDYIFAGRVFGNSFSILKREEAENVVFWVQVPCYPEGNRSTTLKILETEIINL